MITQDNWRTTNPWRDGWYAAARAKLATAKDLGEEGASLTSDFLTYANTARARMRRTYNPLMRFWWLVRMAFAARLARRCGLAAYHRIYGQVHGKLKRYVQDENFPYRKECAPAELADRLDILTSLFLRSPFKSDRERAQRCASMGMWLVDANCGVSLHTTALLLCGSAQAELAKGYITPARQDIWRAQLVFDILLQEIFGRGVNPGNLPAMPGEKLQLARHVGRIARKLAELYAALDEPSQEVYKRMALDIFRSTGAHNQLLQHG